MLAACDTFLPAFCSILIGMLRVMVWQLYLAKPSLVALVVLPSGRKLPKSNAPAKSTKNGSSIGPQKTCSPLVALVMALFISVV